VCESSRLFPNVFSCQCPNLSAMPRHSFRIGLHRPVVVLVQTAFSSTLAFSSKTIALEAFGRIWRLLLSGIEWPVVAFPPEPVTFAMAFRLESCLLKRPSGPGLSLFRQPCERPHMLASSCSLEIQSRQGTTRSELGRNPSRSGLTHSKTTPGACQAAVENSSVFTQS
jgi:hypothetical protein